MREIKKADDLLDDMWGLICNVRQGNLELEDKQWVEAFERIRTKYFDYMDDELTTRITQEERDLITKFGNELSTAKTTN